MPSKAEQQNERRYVFAVEAHKKNTRDTLTRAYVDRGLPILCIDFNRRKIMLGLYMDSHSERWIG